MKGTASIIPMGSDLVKRERMVMKEFILLSSPLEGVSLTTLASNGYHLGMGKREISTILFDLDGTLLPMDQHQFMQAYLQAFLGKCDVLALDSEKTLGALGTGLTAMINNDGSMTNEQRFWNEFLPVAQLPDAMIVKEFMEFYTKEFKELRSVVVPTPLSRQIVENVLSKGYRTVLATTPIFPRQATLERMNWADLDQTYFELITTYEHFSHAKPHLGYYRQILSMLNIDPTSCLMVGNDVEEDLVVQELGMQTYLVTDWLINPKNKDISNYNQGSLQDLLDYVQSLASREGV